MWPVMTHDSVKFSRVDKVGSGSSRTACLTVIIMNSYPGMRSSALRNKSNMNPLHRAYLTGLKSHLIPWVSHCTKPHSCWRDFCGSAYMFFVCRRATPSSIHTDPSQSYNFSSIRVSCDLDFSIKLPKEHMPVII